MENTILGIHHITAIAGDAKRNFNFYANILGLRFIKKTVNFDDPGTYHFYFGDEVGSAGTILTFFPWGDGIPQGRRGSGMATEIGYSVPKGSLELWVERFEKYNVIYNKPAEKFGERYLTFLDPDGLKFELIESATQDNRKPWETDEVKANIATRGFHNITITLNSITGTAAVLTDIFGYKLIAQEGNRYRYAIDTVDQAAIVDLVELKDEKRGHVANGTVHHVAFRVLNDEILMHFREKVAAAGLSITPQIDRNYFHSLYFREPGGVLFEIATDNPGFTVDEALEDLGKGLKLPAQYESRREDIEAHLVPIN
ncbi:ring-cleaving dioxygenase [Flavobacterium subsaxonicum]|uniref:Diguanylate cyclase n=1 Tax=Flavobacterium subsaxonicum WB 4.1-42 = DSM 21790 TaxID=1121898 RepID=A0A0A2MJQ0_9FLAO|nr:ring-cleaving dioxygenase [Flavobacterium subsaxonicum]KGO91668.1 diguanylate cyclase [Flavobacterium subsaxonicum WB 4.1-42 = DSM 21790]